MDRYLKACGLVPCGGEAFVLQTLFVEALRTIELPLETYMYVHTVCMSLTMENGMQRSGLQYCYVKLNGKILSCIHTTVTMCHSFLLILSVNPV